MNNKLVTEIKYLKAIEKNNNDEVLIQEMIEEIAFSGVILLIK